MKLIRSNINGKILHKENIQNFEMGNIPFLFFINKNKEPFEGAGFNISDDTWDLRYRETTSIVYGMSTFMFHFYPLWLKPFVKEYFAYKWLFEDNLNNTLRQISKGLKHFVNFLSEIHPNLSSVSEFNGSHVKSFEIWLDRNKMAEGSKSDTWSAIRDFSSYLRKWKSKMVDKSFYLRHRVFIINKNTPKNALDYRKKAIPLEVTKQIMSAIRQEEEKLEAEINAVFTSKQKQLIRSNQKKKERARKNLILCQALKVLIATGRRVSQIMLLERYPLRLSKAPEATGVWVRWFESKTRQGYQEVFVQSPLSEIIIEAVDKARTLSEIYIEHVDEREKNFLFLARHRRNVRQNSHNSIAVLTQDQLRSFVNGTATVESTRKNSLIYRYNIKYNGDYYYIKTHGFRHARFTQLRLGGAGIGTIQNDAKHLSMDMTRVYVDGDEVAQQHILNLIEKEEILGKSKVLIYNKEVRLDEFSSDELKRYRENGMIIQLTRYGYCHLDIEDGICPSGDPCWIGQEGNGCRFHLYGPEHLATIKEDVELIQKDKKEMEKIKPNSPLIGHYKAMLLRYEEIVQEVKNVKGKCCSQSKGGNQCGK